MNQATALTLMANYTNHIDISKMNPQFLMEQTGLTRKEVDENFDELSLSLELNDIIEEYVESFYKLCVKPED